ncbi:MAG: helix-turn-helix domain-containing protein [Ruminococcus sp.]|nr:helix-turn-helix domain-containing protein [Ruminococcus sp.]
MPKRKSDVVNQTIGQRLKMYRHSCGLTQEQVAAVLNINRTTYTKYETGVSEPSHDLLKKMVAIYGTDFNAIFNDNDTFERDVFDGKLQMYNLTQKEQNLISMYRVLKSELREELVAKAKELLEKNVPEKFEEN